MAVSLTQVALALVCVASVMKQNPAGMNRPPPTPACRCSKYLVTLSLLSGARRKQGAYAGIYKVEPKSIHGKAVYVNNARTKAIWFVPDLKDWAIGKWSNRGTKLRDLTSVDNLQKKCPKVKGSIWKYWDGSAWKSNGVVLRCLAFH